jgi:16S rRNA (cytidine1402-2'-O)-methyltransferase
MLFVVATPIGNAGDFTLRALETLKSADLIIGEELKVLRQILKTAGVQGTKLDQLNEHSRAADIEHFVEECRGKKVALVSDCGTPGFCDPGAELVAACAKAGIEIRALPGSSSLMALLSICGLRLDTFLFYGFLPAKTEARAKAWNELKREKRPFVIMETPYRCEKIIADLAEYFPERECVVGLNLTAPNERVLRGKGSDLKKQGPFEEAEPIILVR